jgi:hypothetical protein
MGSSAATRLILARAVGPVKPARALALSPALGVG